MLLGAVWLTTASFVEQQIKETITAEITGLSEHYRDRGLPGLTSVINDRAAASLERNTIYLLDAPEQGHLAGNLYGWPESEADADGWLRFPVERVRDPAQRDDRITDALARTFSLPGDHRLLVGRSLHDAMRLRRAVTDSIIWGMALTVLLGVGGGIFTSRQLLHRVEGISRAIRGIMGGDMSRRMPLGRGGDEFDQLAASLNAMLDEIERLMAGIRDVTDNIAHDLRTPLNRLRSRIDMALLAEHDPAEYRRVLEQTVAEADSLLATFNALLTIAQAEAGSGLGRFEPLDAGLLVADIVELYAPLAEEKGLTLTLNATDGVTVDGDRHLLSQALANLLDNAVKYTPEGGRVTVTVDATGVEVADTGPGIPAEARDRVLERFVRLDATRTTPGNGLGLSLVAAVARLHRARLSLADGGPGLVVRLAFGANGGG
ncbi:MAG: HAMP domain-containing protein [Alphaproteobacteria bacterium]|nr:HAMP domain-containing protein [Alphaproteobacteria bacterium]